MRRVGSILLGLAALTLLVWATHPRNPYLLVIRPWEPILLVGAAVLVGSVGLLRLGRRLRLLCAATMAVVAGLAVHAEIEARATVRRVLTGPPEPLRAIGRHFVVGYRDLAEVSRLADAGLIGGVFISRHNVRGRSATDLAHEIAGFQAGRRANGLPPLVVAVDQEGGTVARLSPPLARPQALAGLVQGGIDLDRLTELAEVIGAAAGADLARIGVTVNLAPVVDLTPEGKPHPLDLHSRIADRAISPDPAVTAAVARGFVKGLALHGVRGTLKHFPGLARVSGDTHHFPASLATPIATLEAADWHPFRKVATETDALIMLGHVSVTAVDPDRPTSASRAVVDGIIRRGWGHHGVLITDDLTMTAAYGRGLCRSVVEGFDAGIDLLLISYDVEKIYPALACAARALGSGTIDRGRLARSRDRLSALRPDKGG